MRAEVFVWAALALGLIAAETLVPGAFLMWFGFAAAAVLLIVLVVPGMSVLLQAALFVALSLAAIAIYRRWFRGTGRKSDRPTLNRRGEQLIGDEFTLVEPIVAGAGRVQIADAFWTVRGPDLPAGARVRIVGTDGMTLEVREA